MASEKKEKLDGKSIAHKILMPCTSLWYLQRKSNPPIWYETSPRIVPLYIISRPVQTDEMQQQAIEVASDAMEKYSIEKDIAQYIKKEVRFTTVAFHSISLT